MVLSTQLTLGSYIHELADLPSYPLFSRNQLTLTSLHSSDRFKYKYNPRYEFLHRNSPIRSPARRLTSNRLLNERWRKADSAEGRQDFAKTDSGARPHDWRLTVSVTDDDGFSPITTNSINKRRHVDGKFKWRVQGIASLRDSETTVVCRLEELRVAGEMAPVVESFQPWVEK